MTNFTFELFYEMHFFVWYIFINPKCRLRHTVLKTGISVCYNMFLLCVMLQSHGPTSPVQAPPTLPPEVDEGDFSGHVTPIDERLFRGEKTVFN